MGVLRKIAWGHIWFRCWWWCWSQVPWQRSLLNVLDTMTDGCTLTWITVSVSGIAPMDRQSTGVAALEPCLTTPTISAITRGRLSVGTGRCQDQPGLHHLQNLQNHLQNQQQLKQQPHLKLPPPQQQQRQQRQQPLPPPSQQQPLPLPQQQLHHPVPTMLLVTPMS